MADRLWVGGSSGVWTLAANWSPATVPVAADDVYITGGSADIDSIDQSSIALGRLVVGAGYSGNIGSGGALHIDAASLDYSGQGTTAIFKGTYTTVTIQDTSSSATAFKLDGDSDTVGLIRILGGKGTILLGADCTINDNIEQIGASGVTTVVQDGITLTSVDIICDSGKMQLEVKPSNLTMFGGDIDVPISTGTLTSASLYGGRLRWTPTAACTITTLTIYAGTFDSKESTAPEFTITNCTIHEAGVLDERSGLQNATYTNPIQMESGRLLLDVGRTVAIA